MDCAFLIGLINKSIHLLIYNSDLQPLFADMRIHVNFCVKKLPKPSMKRTATAGPPCSIHVELIRWMVRAFSLIECVCVSVLVSFVLFLFSVLDILIKNGAELFARDCDGNTALGISARNGSVLCLKRLCPLFKAHGSFSFPFVVINFSNFN